MIKSREKISKILLVAFLISLIFSYTSIFIFSEHECIGDGCDVCYEINLMKNVFDNLLILSLVLGIIRKAEKHRGRIRRIRKINYRLTPVDLRVKLSE